MKDLKEFVNEDRFPEPDFDHMTPPIAILQLMSGKSLKEVLPKVNGWPILGVYNNYKSKFPDVDKELLKLIKE
jgi:hypothetical protein